MKKSKIKLRLDKIKIELDLLEEDKNYNIKQFLYRMRKQLEENRSLLSDY